MLYITTTITIFGWPFVKRFALSYLTVVCLSVCLSVCPVQSCLSVTLVYCGQTVVRIKMKLGMQLGLGPGCIVLDGDPAPLPENGHTPQFSVHVHCGQTAGRIKMPLGMEVGLGPDDCVRWGPSSPQRGIAPSPNFRPMSVVDKLLDGMDQDATWLNGRPRPRPHCVGWGPSCPQRGTAPPPNFQPMFAVAKRLDGSRWHLVQR